MKKPTWSSVKAGGRSQEHLGRLDREVDQEVVEMNLRLLRKSTGRTQEELAAEIAMSQPELSRVEKREDHLLSTLRRYVVALGGELEVNAILNGKRVRLVGV